MVIIFKLFLMSLCNIDLYVCIRIRTHIFVFTKRSVKYLKDRNEESYPPLS